MYTFLHDIRYVIYGFWGLLFVARWACNWMLNSEEQSDFKRRGGVPHDDRYSRYDRDDLFVLFTFHWTLREEDMPRTRRLKRETNRIHVVFVFYSIAVLFFWIVLTASRPHEEKPQPFYQKGAVEDRSIYCMEEPSGLPFGREYNAERQKKGWIPIPDNFCLDKTSDAESVIWINRQVGATPYYYDRKFVYLDHQKWTGEYDEFYHREGTIEESLVVNRRMVGDSLSEEFLFNNKPITPAAFDSIRAAWGLISNLEQ